MSARLAPGTVVGERWELEALLGRGAMGEVWAASDLKSGAEVALKAPRAAALKDEEYLERFARETKVLKKVQSAHVCKLLAAGSAGDVPFMVLERLVGETLGKALTREGALPLDDVAWIGEHVLDALVVAHRAGVLHRDLNPGNVFLVPGDGGSEPCAKVLDFGVAHDSDAAPLTPDQITMGALAYVAPEQMGGAANVDARCDLYAVGSILMHALAGTPPFGAAKGARLVAMKREHDPPSIDELTGEKWPAALSSFLARSLSCDPKRRFPSADVALATFRTVRKKLGGGGSPSFLDPREIEKPGPTGTAPPRTVTVESGRGQRRPRGRG